MSPERKMQKMGPVGEAIAAGFLAGKSRAKIKQEKGFAASNMSHALHRLEARGFFAQLPQQEVEDWKHPPGPTEIVRRQVVKGIGRLDLPDTTGLKKSQIAKSLKRLSESNEYIESLDHVASDSFMDAQNSLRPIITPLALLRMTRAQIVEGARVGFGIELDSDKVGVALTAAIGSSTSEVERRSDEELRLGRGRVSRETHEQTTKNVGLWLDSAALLLTYRTSDPWPSTMNEWYRTFETYHDQGIVTTDMHNWQAFTAAVDRGDQLRVTFPDFVAAYKKSLETIKRYERRKKIQHARDVQYLTKQFGLDDVAKNDEDWVFAGEFLKGLDELMAETEGVESKKETCILKGTETERKAYARTLLMHGMYVRHVEQLTSLAEGNYVDDMNISLGSSKLPLEKRRIRPPKDMQMDAVDFLVQKAVIQMILRKALITDDVTMRHRLEELYQEEQRRTVAESKLPNDIVDVLLLEMYYVGIAKGDSRNQIAYVIAKQILRPERKYLERHEQFISGNLKARSAQSRQSGVAPRDSSAGGWVTLDLEEDQLTASEEVRQARDLAKERQLNTSNFTQEEVDKEDL